METFRVVPLLDSSASLGEPDELIRRAGSDGYLYLRGLFDPNVVRDLRRLVLAECVRLGWLEAGPATDLARAHPALRGIRTGDPQSVELLARVLPSVELDRIRREPSLERILGAVFGGGFETHQGDVCRVVFPNAEHLTTPPHQDGAYVGVERECWTVWTPLGDCPLALGPLALAPGSHRGGLFEHSGGAARIPGEPGRGEWAASDLTCGDALLFHALTIHRALPNRSGDTLRLSVDCRYRAE